MRHTCRETARAASKPQRVVDWSLGLDILVLRWGFGHDSLGIAVGCNDPEHEVSSKESWKASK